MSLMSVLNLSSQALNANQLGIRVVANNMANANTPGYVRQELVMTPAPAQKLGNFAFGLGVMVQGVEQKINQFLVERLRHAKGDLEAGVEQRDLLLELEGVFGELSDTDLSSGLSRFFASIQDVVNQPESVAVRNLAVLEAERLTGDIRVLAERLQGIRGRVNAEIDASVGEANELIEEIARLNVRILEAEGGLVSNGAALALRDQRTKALESLAMLVDIRAIEQDKGSVSVFAGGEYLVFDGNSRRISIESESKNGVTQTMLKLSGTGATLIPTSGRIGGLLAARDGILTDSISRFDDFSRSLVFEFNRIFTSAQGMEGYTSMRSEHRVTSRSSPLDEAGLPFTASSGSFQVLIRDRGTGQTTRTEIPVSLQGLEDDTSLEDVRAALDAIDGLTASVDLNGKLELSVERAGLEFGFADDRGGFLAAMGLGHFFTGSSAATLGVSQAIRSQPARFAISASGFGKDSAAGVTLAALGETRLESLGGLSLLELQERFSVDITQASASARSEVAGLEMFQNALEAEHLAITGVSLDEEAIRLMTYQRAFQASARVVKVVSDLLDVLVNL